MIALQGPLGRHGTCFDETNRGYFGEKIGDQTDDRDFRPTIRQGEKKLTIVGKSARKEVTTTGFGKESSCVGNLLLRAKGKRKPFEAKTSRTPRHYALLGNGRRPKVGRVAPTGPKRQAGARHGATILCAWTRRPLRSSQR